MKTINVLAVAAFALLPLAGNAGDDKTKPASSEKSAAFGELDSNKDGRISMPEASADPTLVESFSKADKNGDGYLDSSEYQSSAAKPKM